MKEDVDYVNRWKLSRADILIVLRYYHELRSGQKIDFSSKHSNNSESQWTGRSLHASFEEPCLLAAEVYTRVKSCGFDGYLVAERYGLDNGVPIPEKLISSIRKIPLKDVYQAINRVVRYCQGRKRKRIAYLDWIFKSKDE